MDNGFDITEASHDASFDKDGNLRIKPFQIEAAHVERFIKWLNDEYYSRRARAQKENR